jgi:hypothetical protein
VVFDRNHLEIGNQNAKFQVTTARFSKKKDKFTFMTPKNLHLIKDFWCKFPLKFKYFHYSFFPNIYYMVVQSILFQKSKWTIANAKLWLKEHEFIHPKVDVTEAYLRFRQVAPLTLQRKGITKFRQKNIGNGIVFILAF